MSDVVPQNYGIIIAFGIVFLSALLLLTEINTSVAGDSTVTLFKRGTKANMEQAVPDDEEKPRNSPPSPTETTGVSEDSREAMKEAPAANTFSFENLTYVVPVGGGQRKLLDNVSGYVAPSKLTALMGESSSPPDYAAQCFI